MTKALALLFSLGLCSHSFAQSDTTREWFKSLTIPGSQTSCCDVSDCKQTEQDFRDGSWWALSPKGKWLQVPKNKVLAETSPLERPVLCSSPSDDVIYCFARKDFGS